MGPNPSKEAKDVEDAYKIKKDEDNLLGNG
jgi:hypothetical protein